MIATDKNRFDWVFILIVTGCFFIVSSALAETDDRWGKKLRFSASLTTASSAHTEHYPGVSGLGGEEAKSSWQLGADGRFRRDYEKWNQEHRITMRYGRVDNEESEDEIDFYNIVRRRFSDALFGYGSARVRSEFDTFGHPTKFDGAIGAGAYLFESDTYGALETRLGARWSRGWNPSRDGDGFYELIAEYNKYFAGGGQFTSALEAYSPFDDSNYTVRWDNTILASLNSWLDVEYLFTLYYEDDVGETATQSLARLNLIYYFWKE